jgi:hypothetical protein
MMSLYVLIVFVSILIAYAGVDETMKLFYYADLQLRNAWVQLRMGMMRRKLKAQLIKDTTDFEKFLKEYKK